MISKNVNSNAAKKNLNFDVGKPLRNDSNIINLQVPVQNRAVTKRTLF